MLDFFLCRRRLHTFDIFRCGASPNLFGQGQWGNLSQRFGSGSARIHCIWPDPDQLQSSLRIRIHFDFFSQIRIRMIRSGQMQWIRVEPKLCREKSKTATTSTNLPSRLHYFFNFFVWNRVNIHYLPT